MLELKNKNIVLTRPEAQAKFVVNELEKLGAYVILFPTIIIKPLEDNNELKETFTNINQFDSIIFTSENAVKYFVRTLEKYDINFDTAKYFIVSIGQKTNEVCEHYKIRVDLVPSEYSWEGLINEVERNNIKGKKIFIPCSTLSDINKYKALEKYGFEINAIPVYQNTLNSPYNLAQKIEQIKKTKIDLYIFSSPSTFKGFLEILQIENPAEYFSGKNVAVIGPVTQKALEMFDVHVSIVPQKYTMDDLIKEITVFFKKSNTIFEE